jgi:hypothetical protein
LNFEYLLEETTVREIVKFRCYNIWNGLEATEMPEKTENDWVNIADVFYQRTQFPNCIDAVNGKHFQIKMTTVSGSLFYNYKHFFTIILLALVHANYCFIAVDIGALRKSSHYNVFYEIKHRKETGIESTGNPRGQTVA